MKFVKKIFVRSVLEISYYCPKEVIDMYVFEEDLAEGVFIRRYKRFFVDVALRGGEVVTAHCTNTGSLKSCLVPGAKVLLSRSKNPHRKTAFTWEMIKIGDTWVGVNTQLSNKIVYNALKNNKLKELSGFEVIRSEYKKGKSRIDFYLEKGGEKMLLEVKNVTYREGDYALFPDAPTQRGLKHLNELEEAMKEGHRVGMLYTVSRTDTDVFAPAKKIDPVYAEALVRLKKKGLEIYPYQVEFTPEKAEIVKLLPYEF